MDRHATGLRTLTGNVAGTGQQSVAGSASTVCLVPRRWSDADADGLIEEILGDASDDSEQLSSFACGVRRSGPAGGMPSMPVLEVDDVVLLALAPAHRAVDVVV